MTRDHSTGDIPEDRPLSDEERSLVRWMLEHGESHAPSFLSQLEQARVGSRCRCGCASVNFSVAGKEPAGTGMDILSDQVWEEGEGHFGVFVFGLSGSLAGLEVYSLDGAVTPTWLPRSEQLRPFPHATQQV